MNHPMKAISALTTVALFLVACGEKAPNSPSVKTDSHAPAVASQPSHPTDQWLGRWNGPEGTFLDIAGGQGKYDLTIQNLDGPTHYEGVGVGNEIQFERDGVKESIHATNGAQTGMKWLSEKTDCLTVHTGEGYCKN